MATQFLRPVRREAKPKKMTRMTNNLRLHGCPTPEGAKHDQDKLAFDLYPIDAYKGCTAVLTFGAKKYAPNNWKKVEPKSRYYAALMRHLVAQIEHEETGGKGLALDEETGLPHLDHAQCCLIFYRELTKIEK